MHFFHPDGRLLTGQPSPLRAELRESLFTAFAAVYLAGEACQLEELENTGPDGLG